MTPMMAVDSADFVANFPERSFKIRHLLCSRPEFDLSRLVNLGSRLPPADVEYFAGNVPVNQDPETYPTTGLSVAETIRRIEECGSWMVLKNVEQDAQYGKLLRDCLHELYVAFGCKLTGMHREEAFVFISSPNAVTPYHMDPEHNFLLQIRGRKQMTVFDAADRIVAPETEAERGLQIRHPATYHRNMPYKPEFEARGTVFGLSPGEGLHVPCGAPHWVRNGPEVSISFSVTFRSSASDRLAIIYYVNRKIRELGLTPTPPLRSAWRDSVKFGAYDAARRTARAVRRARERLGQGRATR